MSMIPFMSLGVVCAGPCLPPAQHAMAGRFQTVEYKGLRPTDPGGRDGLRNPERGWRIETLFAELPDAPAWGPAYHLKGKVAPQYNDDWWILDAQAYEKEGLTLAQTYCYLDAFVDRPISEEKLDMLQQSLDNVRAHGLKALLRFAYERDMDRRSGPNLARILEHMDQLAPIIARNVDVIYVLQAGFVGAWGEWHSSAQALESDQASLAAVVGKLLQNLPEGRMTQVRVPKYKRWVLEQPVLGGVRPLDASLAHTDCPAARIGFHNDGFLAGPSDGGTWPEGPLYGKPGNPEFDVMTAESPFVPVDGELFWSDQSGQVDGREAAVRMNLHHYSSFSLAHSFSEREGKPFAIDQWRVSPLTQAQVRASGLPLSDGYFEDEEGQPVDRTPFEYIRDHLGYRLELQRALFPKKARPGKGWTVQVELINRGFSTVHNPRPVFLVLVGESGAVEIQVPNADPRQWQPYRPGDAGCEPLLHQIVLKSDLPEDLEPGRYLLGLWLPDASPSLREDPRYAIRVANRDVPWWTDKDGRCGANLLGEIRIER